MTKIYCGNLPSGIAERDLEDEFIRFGTLRSVWVARKPPGFAFIEFEDPRDADDACRKLDGFKGWVRFYQKLRDKCHSAKHVDTRVEISRSGGPRPRAGPPGGGGGYGGGGYGAGAGAGAPAYGGRRSPSPVRRRRSPSYERPRRSPSPVRRRRSPSYEGRRSLSPVRRDRSLSRSPLRRDDRSP